jgi:osmoprotectant transport system permease protein
MSVTAPEAPPREAVAADPYSGGAELRDRASVAGRYLFMPAMLAVACLLLYLWVSSKELDSIEQRLLNADVVVSSVVRHLQLVGVSTVLVILLAVPLGVLLTRPFARPFVPPIIGAANMGQSVPSLGVIALLALLFGIGFRYAVIALIAYAFLPVLRNTMVGLQQVDPAVIEAGRGMGMTKKAVLTKIELPLAVPVVLAGVRTALVINVGTATIAVLTNAGGLGAIIYSGIVQNRRTVLIAGSILAAVLALFVDYVAGIAEEHLRPRGL